MYLVKFLISEEYKYTDLESICDGKVRDPHYGFNMNKIYYSDNYGPYKIINIDNNARKKKITIVFLNTGNTITTYVKDAFNGSVYDPSANYKTPIDTLILNDVDRLERLLRIAYSMWYHMNKRCFNNNANNYKYYGKLGIKICDRWMNFNNFWEDLPSLFQYEKWYRYPSMYQLDKDYLQLNIAKENRVYSPETCVLLHYLDNANIAKIESSKFRKANYFGITKETDNTFSSHLIINGFNLYLGTFDDEIVAANVYNYWYKYYHNYDIIPLLNNVPFIPNTEFIKHNRRPKSMCFIVQNERNKDYNS
jgi:hypothetical protein